MKFYSKCTAHPTYEALLWILIKLDRFLYNFKANAMHTQLMNCCFGFQSQWRVYDVSTNYMKYTNLIYEVLFWFLFKLDRFL